MTGAIIYICFFFMYTAISGRIKHTYRMDMVVFGLFTVSLSVVAFHSIPAYDLYRHYLFVKTIQMSGTGYMELIASPLLGWEHNRFYLAFDLLCYLDAKIGIFNLLPAFMVAIDYLILGYISIDWNRKHFQHKGYFISMVISFAFMPFLHAAAGMRNATAVSLVALGIYLYFEKKAGFVVLAVLILLGLLIHPSVLMAVPFIFLSDRNLSCKKILLVFIMVLGIQEIAVVFASSSLSFFEMLGKMYLQYSSQNQYLGSRRYLYFDLVCIIIFLINYFMSWKQKKEHSRLEKFFVFYMIFILGNIGNYDLIIRPSYLFAPLICPVLTTVYDGLWNVKKRQEVVLKCLSLLVLLCGAVFIIYDYMYIYINEYF